MSNKDKTDSDKRNRKKRGLLKLESKKNVHQQPQDDWQTPTKTNEELSIEIEVLQTNLQIQSDLNKVIDKKWKTDRERMQKAEKKLSELAAFSLTHENTNIVDLSDANRPSKMAEAYSELYDNEWTYAFEELISGKRTEKEAIDKLRNMLLISFRKCREITWDRYQSLKSFLSNIDIPLMANSKEVCEHHTCTATMTLEQEIDIKRLWLTTTTALRDEAVKHLESVLLMTFDISNDDFPKTSRYLTVCIDLCWKMGMQEKPMHLDAVAETREGATNILDLNKYKPFTKTGKEIDFVVWPALFLYEGGPMLVKGIAQGCREMDQYNDA